MHMQGKVLCARQLARGMWFLITLVLSVLVLVERGCCHGGVCEDPDTVNAQICETLFRLSEDSLLLITESSSSPLELPDCSCPTGAACLNRTFLNTNAELVTLRYGWTIAAIYTFIHPALLNQLQIQLPFALMRLTFPDKVPFLWNDYNQLPSTSVHLTISTDNLNC